jgi:hypothetical protein
VLSDVLRTVRLTGALYFQVEARSPWEIAVPDGATLAPVVLPRAQHVISYHVVTGGACWGRIAGGRRRGSRPATAGSRTATRTRVHDRAIGGGPKGHPRIHEEDGCQLSFVVAEGAGPGAPTSCAASSVRRRPFNPLLGTLPASPHSRFVIAGDSLPQLIDLTIAERARRAGGECMRFGSAS